MRLSVVILFVAVVAIGAPCDGGTIGYDGRPAVKTDLQLTASDSDSGNWTANLGDMEVR
jgi:hypothetical protein